MLYKEIFKEWIIFRWALNCWRLIESSDSCYVGWHQRFAEVQRCWWRNFQEKRKIKQYLGYLWTHLDENNSCSQMYLQDQDGSQVLPAGQNMQQRCYFCVSSQVPENRPTLLTCVFLLTCLCTFKHSLSAVIFFLTDLLLSNKRKMCFRRKHRISCLNLQIICCKKKTKKKHAIFEKMKAFFPPQS